MQTLSKHPSFTGLQKAMSVKSWPPILHYDKNELAYRK